KLRRICVELVVTEEPKRAAVKRVASALVHDRKEGAAGSSVGRREPLRRQRELLDAFHREVLKYAADRVVFVVAAVDCDVQVSAGRSADRKGPNASLCRIE